MVEDEIKGSGLVYTKDFLAELERRYAAYKDGSDTGITKDESKRRIKEVLTSKKK